MFRKSNVKLFSNISVLNKELCNDKEFHNKVRGRKALSYLASKSEANTGSIDIELNNLQLAELTHAGICFDSCKQKNSWGLVVDKNNDFYVECRCDFSECPQFDKCKNNRIYINDTFSIANSDVLKNNLFEEVEPQLFNLSEELKIIENEVESLHLNSELKQKDQTDLVDKELMMSCLVSIERISGSIMYLKDIAERLEKDVSIIRKKLHDKVSQHKYNQ